MHADLCIESDSIYKSPLQDFTDNTDTVVEGLLQLISLSHVYLLFIDQFISQFLNNILSYQFVLNALTSYE